MKGELREIGLALINSKEELSLEKQAKEIILEELQSLRQQNSNSNSSSEAMQQQQQQVQQHHQRSSSLTGPLKGVTDLSSRLDEAKSSERQLLRKVVELNETVEKLGREKERLKEEILRVNEAQDRDAIAWREKEADLEGRLEAALERANTTR